MHFVLTLLALSVLSKHTVLYVAVAFDELVLLVLAGALAAFTDTICSLSFVTCGELAAVVEIGDEFTTSDAGVVTCTISAVGDTDGVNGGDSL